MIYSLVGFPSAIGNFCTMLFLSGFQRFVMVLWLTVSKIFLVWKSDYLSLTLYKAIYPVRSMQLSLILRSMQVALKSETATDLSLFFLYACGWKFRENLDWIKVGPRQFWASYKGSKYIILSFVLKRRMKIFINLFRLICLQIQTFNFPFRLNPGSSFLPNRCNWV